MAGKKSLRKGQNEERSIVNLLRSHGFECKRTLESGARSDGSVTWDIDLVLHRNFKGECKVRKNGFKSIYDWMSENDFVTIRADRSERLYVFPEEVVLELLGRVK